MLPIPIRIAAPRFLAAAALLILPADPVGATSIRLMNLQELADSSERIFQGVCTAVETGPDENGTPCTRSTFAVSESIHGNVASGVTIKQFGSRESLEDAQGRRYGFHVEGMPEYEVGREYILFLNSDSSLGFCGPVGLMQGTFEVRRGARGPDGESAEADAPARVVNGVDNRNLFMDTSMPLNARMAERQVRGGEPLEDERVSGELPRDEFVSLVRELKSGRRLDLKEANRRFGAATHFLQGGAGNVY